MNNKYFFCYLFALINICCFAQINIQKIDVNILNKQSNEYDYVLMFQNNDFSTIAKGIKGKEAKTNFVYNNLKIASHKNQKRVVEYLRKNKIYYESFIISNCIRVKSDYKTLVELADFEEVKRVSYNFDISAPRFDEESLNNSRDAEPEWGLKMIQADSVWKLGYEGQNVVVAGEDTGYDWKVEPLRKKYRGYENDSTANHSYNWYDAIKDKSPLSADSLNPCGFDSKEPCDDNNHGTHTMGTMVGSDSNNIIGVAPLAKWIGCRNMERGNGQLSTYLGCFEWFLAPTDIDGFNPNPSLAPHVINNSWYCSFGEGCNPSNWEALNVAVKNLKAAGVVVVVSAGNEGPNCESVTGPPGIFEASFSVGATTMDDNIANFSSRGPVSIDSSFRMKPDISAPGTGIKSVIRGGSFAFFNGTSMAGPHVAGAVALLISANPDLAGEVELIENILKETAVPKFSEQECGGLSSQVIPNPIFGYGRLNVLKAVEKALLTVVNFNEEIEVPTLFKVFPNPTNDLVNIQAFSIGEFNYTLKSADNKLIKKGLLKTDKTLDISAFHSGIYFLELRNETVREIIKVVKY